MQCPNAVHQMQCPNTVHQMQWPNAATSYNNVQVVLQNNYTLQEKKISLQ